MPDGLPVLGFTPAIKIIGRTIGKICNRFYAVFTERDEHWRGYAHKHSKLPHVSSPWVFKARWLSMLSGGIRLAICSLALCIASSAAVAQENLERGKILYASECEKCHKSPESVTTFHGGLDLETFLREQHYAATPESAAAIATYLKDLESAPRHDVAYCVKHFKSYDPDTRTYLGKDGRRHSCR